MLRSLPVRALLAIVPVALLLVVSATTSEAETDASMPRVRVLLTDAPSDLDVDILTISRAELHGAGQEVVMLFDEPRDIDLSTLRDGLTPELVDEEIAPGTYVHLRLYLVGTDGEPDHVEDISLPRLELDASDETAVVTLDFDAPAAFTPSTDTPSATLLPTTFRMLSAEIYR